MFFNASLPLFGPILMYIDQNHCCFAAKNKYYAVDGHVTVHGPGSVKAPLCENWHFLLLSCPLKLRIVAHFYTTVVNTNRAPRPRNGQCTRVFANVFRCAAVPLIVVCIQLIILSLTQYHDRCKVAYLVSGGNSHNSFQF